MNLIGEGLFFRYGKGPWIVKDFHICIRPGQRLGLVGPSGCGKTTVARMLAGYQRPERGSVRLGEETYPLRGFHPVQYIAQHPEKAVNPRWRMKQVLEEAGAPDSALLEELGIEEGWMDRWPEELSGGELQRFCIARALRPETRFLIADEITTMLDAVTQASIWRVLLRICREREIGLLAVSHDPALLACICEKTLEMKKE